MHYLIKAMNEPARKLVQANILFTNSSVVEITCVLSGNQYQHKHRNSKMSTRVNRTRDPSHVALFLFILFYFLFFPLLVERASSSIRISYHFIVKIGVFYLLLPRGRTRRRCVNMVTAVVCTLRLLQFNALLLSSIIWLLRWWTVISLIRIMLCVLRGWLLPFGLWIWRRCHPLGSVKGLSTAGTTTTGIEAAVCRKVVSWFCSLFWRAVWGHDIRKEEHEEQGSSHNHAKGYPATPVAPCRVTGDLVTPAISTKSENISDMPNITPSREESALPYYFTAIDDTHFGSRNRMSYWY